jgi:DNA-binding beta-propeller fold protein YncE
VQAQFDGTAGVDGLAGDISFAVSPDGRNVYAPGFEDNTLAVFAPEPARALAAASALAALAAIARRRQRGLRITTGMSRVVPAWYLS